MMFLGNDPKRERAFIPPPPPSRVKRGGSAWTKQNKENHFPNKQTRLVFVSSGWLCGVLNPVKSLYKQTYTRAQRRQRTENNQAEDRPLLFSFYIPLVNMST